MFDPEAIPPREWITQGTVDDQRFPTKTTHIAYIHTAEGHLDKAWNLLSPALDIGRQHKPPKGWLKLLIECALRQGRTSEASEALALLWQWWHPSEDDYHLLFQRVAEQINHPGSTQERSHAPL